MDTKQTGGLLDLHVYTRVHDREIEIGEVVARSRSDEAEEIVVMLDALPVSGVLVLRTKVRP